MRDPFGQLMQQSRTMSSVRKHLRAGDVQLRAARELFRET